MAIVRDITVKHPTEAETFTRLQPFSSVTQQDLAKAIRMLFHICESTGVSLHIEPRNNDINDEIQRNDVLRSVQELLTVQTAKGLAKYGHTVTPDALSLREWIEHVQQEHADAIVYLEVLKRRLSQEVTTMPQDYDKLIQKIESDLTFMQTQQLQPGEDDLVRRNKVDALKLALLYLRGGDMHVHDSAATPQDE